MSNDSKIKDTINKLVSKYSKTSWGNILPAIFQTEEFDMALNQLVSDVQAGQPFTPHLNNLFKSMDLCKFEDVKVVFVNTYPTAGTDKPTGLAFAGGEPNSFTREINGKKEFCY
jgi:uracil DNA glycosylase